MKNKFLVASYLMILMILLISIVSATTFYEDTELNQGDITYIFKKGITVDSFDLDSGGIKLDDQTIMIGIQGGSLTVNIYEWENIDSHRIGFVSSVPQPLTFAVRNNGADYYFYDGVTYSLDEFNIGTEEIIGKFRTFDDTTKNIIYSPLEADKWYSKNFFQEPVIW